MVTLPLKNVDFRLKNVDFSLNNVDFIIYTAEEGDAPRILLQRRVLYCFMLFYAIVILFLYCFVLFCTVFILLFILFSAVYFPNLGITSKARLLKPNTAQDHGEQTHDGNHVVTCVLH